jgi:hypothetical protein
MGLFNNDGKNLDKLSKNTLKKALDAQSSSDLLNILMEEKNKVAPVAEKTSAEQIESITHTVNPESYEANLTEQSDLLTQGSKEINERISESKNKVQDKENKTPALQVEEISIGKSQNRDNEEKNNDLIK